MGVILLEADDRFRRMFDITRNAKNYQMTVIFVFKVALF